MQKVTYDCTIIGAGPAGLVAATYLQRFHRRVLVIDRGDSRLACVPKIRNLIGYSNGISGKALLSRLRLQALKYGAEFISGEAEIFRKAKKFETQVGDRIINSKYVLLATGTKDLQPKGINFFDLCKKGVLAYCPICDAFDHSCERIGIIIGTNAGFKKIKFIYNFSSKIHLILIRDLTIPARHLELIKKLNVTVHKGALRTLKFNPRKQSLIVSLKNQYPFEVKTAYVALGTKVNKMATSHLHGLRKTKEGYFLVNAHQETSVKGLYAAGDCVNSLSQVSVAVGQAAIAATDIHNHISG